MFTHRSPRGSHPRTATRPAAARLRRLAAALAAVTCALIPAAFIIPAASARILIPDDGPAGPAPVPAATVHVISGGMPGWQITLIALGAALVAATAAVLMDRARTTRRAAPATTS